MTNILNRLVPIEVDEVVEITTAEGNTRSVTVKVPAKKDPKDGEIYFGPDAAAIVDKARARMKGVLSPQELAQLRSRLGLTQKQIAEILQIGEKTWTRWENGTETPSHSSNLLIVALSEGKITVPWLRGKLASNNEPMQVAFIPSRNWSETAVHIDVGGYLTVGTGSIGPFMLGDLGAAQTPWLAYFDTRCENESPGITFGMRLRDESTPQSAAPKTRRQIFA